METIIEQQTKVTTEVKEKVVVFPGTEELDTLSVGELTDLRSKLEMYDNYIKRLIRKKILMTL